MVCHRHTGPMHGGLIVCAVVIGVLAFPGFAAAGERVLDERKSERVEAMILRVKPAFKDDEEHITDFLRDAADRACGPGLAKLPAAQRKARMRDTLNDQRNRIIGFPGAVLWHDFLFLIPAETIQQMVKGIGLTPRTNDPFMAEWEQAVAAYFRGDYGRALDRLEGADRLIPGLGDVQRLRFLLKDLLEFRREPTPARSSQ